MVTAEDILVLRNARPFVPFRLYLSEGDPVVVPDPQMILPGRNFAVVGLRSPLETVADGWVTVWYPYITRVELLTPDTPA
jgi:hypothetical protein